MKNLLLLLALVLSLGACKNEGSASKDNADATPKTKYKLTPFKQSTEYPDANMTSMVYTDGTFKFGVEGDNYQLGQQTPDAGSKMCANSAKGQHIHLLVDDQPYAAKYTPEFEYPMADGVSHVLAFLSRSYHESIKTPNAFIAQKLKIKDGNVVGSKDVKEPRIWYSRPKGTYVGDDTKKVMLDFYLVNVPELGGEYFVKATINGEDHILDKWQPYYIEGLPMGTNTITLSLINADGDDVKVAFNPVTRVFTLKELLNPEK